MLAVVHCGIGSSSRVRACTPLVQHFCGGYQRGLHAFQGGQRHRGRFGVPEEENVGGRAEKSNHRRASPGDVTLGYDLSCQYRSRLAIQLGKMMGVIVIVCAAFDLAVSEGKTEFMRLRTKGMPESTPVFSVEAAGQMYNQTNEFVYLGGNINHNADCPSRSTGAYATHGTASRSKPSNCTTDRALPSSSNPGW